VFIAKASALALLLGSALSFCGVSCMKRSTGHTHIHRQRTTSPTPTHTHTTRTTPQTLKRWCELYDMRDIQNNNKTLRASRLCAQLLWCELYDMREIQKNLRAARVGLHKRFVLSKAFLHWSIVLVLPPPSALLALLQYHYTTNAQYATPHPTPPWVCHIPYNIGNGNIL